MGERVSCCCATNYSVLLASLHDGRWCNLSYRRLLIKEGFLLRSHPEGCGVAQARMCGMLLLTSDAFLPDATFA